MDETFTVVSKSYIQIPTIGFILNLHDVPCVSAFLKNESENTYLRLFRLLEELANPVNRSNIKMEFGIAPFNAIKTVHVNANVSECLFHLGQSVYKRVSITGLSILNDGNDDIRIVFKGLTSLAFVCPEWVEITFLELRSCVNFPAPLNQF